MTEAVVKSQFAQFREGFIEAETKPEPKPEPPKKVATLPTPEPHIEPSPAEKDKIEVAVQEWPIVVQLLYKPIKNNKGQLVDRLSFREPKGGDINRYGNPTRVNQEGDVIIDERKMHFIMSALCDVLPPLLEELHPRDWNTCAYVLRDFFLPDMRAWLGARTN
jgi:hypothetical protein